MSFWGDLLSDELNTLKIKWKESENINKQLLFELESNIQNHKEMEEELNMTKTMLYKKNNNIKINVNNSDLTESKNINYENHEGSKMNNYIETEGKEGEPGEGEDPGKRNKEINQLHEKIRI